MNVAVAPKSAASISRRIRVMIVDDAVVVRGLFSRWVEAEPDLELVASLRTGREAVNQIECADPDVVVLDVDMPDLDGIAALPLLLEKKPDLVVMGTHADGVLRRLVFGSVSKQVLESAPCGVLLVPLAAADAS